MYDYELLRPIERKINFYLEQVKTQKHLSKEEGFAKCRAYLTDYKCQTVILKVKDDYKWDWFIRNFDNLKKIYPETTLELETIYVANLYQSIWDDKDSDTTLLANSLGQFLRQEMTIEDISEYPIEWMVLVE